MKRTGKTIGLLWLLLLVGVVINGVRYESGRSANQTLEERQAEITREQEAEEQRVREAQARKEQEAAFNQEMRTYETEHTAYQGGKPGQYATFVLTKVARKDKYVFGEQLPLGVSASL